MLALFSSRMRVCVFNCGTSILHRPDKMFLGGVKNLIFGCSGRSICFQGLDLDLSCNRANTMQQGGSAPPSVSMCVCVCLKNVSTKMI
jgi:hypothetical protein